jgi:hypothetical protein
MFILLVLVVFIGAFLFAALGLFLAVVVEEEINPPPHF